MPKQLSNKHFLFVFLAILVVFHFFNPNFSNLISGNFSSENGKCQNNSTEVVKTKIEQNRDKLNQIKQKLEFEYPKFVGKISSNQNQTSQKSEPNILLENQVFWSIDKSAKCSENNLIRFDVANTEQKEIIKSVLDNKIEYEIWNR